MDPSLLGYAKWNEEIGDLIFDCPDHIDYQLMRLEEQVRARRAYIRMMNTSAGERGPSKEKPYLFLTVKPSSDIDPHKFFKHMHKAMSLKVFLGGVYCFEQRSSTPGHYYGHHSHALMKIRNAPSKVEQVMKAKFKKIGFIKMIFVAESEVKRIHDYILGKKKDESKQGKCRNDIPYRELYKLEPVYYTGAKNLLGTH